MTIAALIVGPILLGSAVLAFYFEGDIRWLFRRYKRSRQRRGSGPGQRSKSH